MKLLKLVVAYFNPGVLNEVDWGEIKYKYLKSIFYIVFGVVGVSAIEYFEVEKGSFHLFALCSIFFVSIIFGILLFLSGVNDFMDRNLNVYVKKLVLYLVIGVPLFILLLTGVGST